LPAITERAPRRRWRIAWLLGLGVLVNYFDRVNLSVSHGALYTAFGISDVAFGYLSAAYNWSYALCQLPVGVVLDRFGVRRVQRNGILIWSMASFAAAITPNLAGFFGARLLLGIGEAPTFPANAKAIGTWFPQHERSFATSLTDAAAKLASAIGVPLLGILLIHVGWRWSFAATGAISLLYLLLFRRVYCEPEEDAELSDAERHLIAEIRANEPPAASGPELSLGALLRQRKVIGLSLGFGAYNYVFYLLLTWLPSYLSMALHIDLLHSFLYTGFPWLIATATDLFVGGMLVDALVSRGWNAELVRKIVLVVGTACGLGILGAAHAHSAMRALAWISLSIGGLAAAAPVGWSIPARIVPRASVGKVGGIVNFVCQVSGITAQILTGYIVRATHSYALAFGISAMYLLLGIAGYLVLLGRIEPMQTAHFPAA
jgi:ACS family D-galactonate transporter-like MFS transporter